MPFFTAGWSWLGLEWVWVVVAREGRNVRNGWQGLWGACRFHESHQLIPVAVVGVVDEEGCLEVVDQIGT